MKAVPSNSAHVRQAGNAANGCAVAVKWLAAGLLVVGVVLLIRAAPLEQTVQRLQTWLDGLGMWGPFAFFIIYVTATVLLIPGSVMTLAAGALFGLVGGTALVSVSSTTGAALAFLIARYLARDRAAATIRRYPKFAAVDQAIGRQGWKIVVLLRLSPAIPFNVQNYLYGLTSIRFWPCVLSSWLAMLPGTFVYVYLGWLGGLGVRQAAIDHPVGIGMWILHGVGLLATVAVTLYITHVARKALREQTAIDKSTDDQWSPESTDEAPAASDARSWPWGALLWLAAGIAVVAVGIWANR